VIAVVVVASANHRRKKLEGLQKRTRRHHNKCDEKCEKGCPDPSYDVQGLKAVTSGPNDFRDECANEEESALVLRSGRYTCRNEGQESNPPASVRAPTNDKSEEEKTRG